MYSLYFQTNFSKDYFVNINYLRNSTLFPQKYVRFISKQYFSTPFWAMSKHYEKKISYLIGFAPHGSV